MNKKLLAAALGVAFAAPVFADSSSLTLYGRIHTTLEHTNNEADKPVDGQRATIRDVSSRIGIDVKEDLGGGLKLLAGYEFAVSNSDNAANLNDGTASTSDGGGIDSGRNGTIGFATNFGTVQVGTQDGGRGTVAPMYVLGGKILGGLSNNGGRQAQTESGLGNDDAVISANQRTANSISYKNTFGGIGVQVRHANTGRNDSGGNNANGSESSSRETEIGLTYSIAGFDLAFAAFNADVSGTLNASDIENSYLLGGSYGFGPLTVGLAYQMNSYKGKNGLNGNEDQDQNVAVSATYKLGGGSTLFALYGDGERAFFGTGANQVGADLQQLQLMYGYDFSKRTRMYVGFQRISTDPNGVTAETDEDYTAIGLRHNF